MVWHLVQQNFLGSLDLACPPVKPESSGVPPISLASGSASGTVLLAGVYMGLWDLFFQLVWIMSGPVESFGVLGKSCLLTSEAVVAGVVCAAVAEVCWDLGWGAQ